MNLSSLAGVLALLPAMVGPLPQDQGHPSLMLALCGGGAMQVALRDRDGAPLPTAPVPCCAKGCHAGHRKKLLDRGQ
jgi:hypothetical protein